MNKTRFYIFITLMLNIVFAQIALPSFQAVHKPHNTASGTEYFVGVAINGSGGAYVRANGSIPNTYGNIKINSTAYKYGNFSSNTMPTSWDNSNRTDYIFGMPDITFVPN